MNIDLRGAFWTPSATILGSASKVYDRILRSIFANGEQGFAYDPNDLTTLFQDAAGTIPVTSTGQPVGMMLDKSKGLLLGAELFNDATVVRSGGVARESSGVYLIDAPDTIQYIGLPLPIKGRYLLDFEILSLDYGTLRIDATGSLSSYRYNSTGRFIQYVSHLRDLSFIAIARDSSPTKARIRVNSIRQVLGNHAYQTVSASRPVLQQTPTLGSELVINGDFSDGLTNVAPRNVVTTEVVAGALKVTNTGTYYGYAEMTLPTAAGKTYLLRADVISSSGAGAAFHVSSVPNSSDIATNVEGIATAVGFMFTAKTAITYVSLKTPSNATGAWRIFDNVSVKEVTGYRTDQNYLAFDGVDDFLITNNVDFTATDKISIFASVRKFSDASQAVVVELGSGVFLETKGAFTLYAPASAAVAGYRYLAQGKTAANINVSSDAVYAAPNTAVLTASSDILTGDIGLRVSGTPSSAKAGAIDKGGKHINAPLYVGRRTGSVLSLNGNIYGLIIVGRLTTDDETSAVERILATDAGVTLNV